MYFVFPIPVGYHISWASPRFLQILFKISQVPDFSRNLQKYPRFGAATSIETPETYMRTCTIGMMASWMIMNIYIYISNLRQVYERFSHMLTTFYRLGDLIYTLRLPPHYISTNPHNACCSRHDPRPCPRRLPFTYSYYCDHTYWLEEISKK